MKLSNAIADAPDDTRSAVKAEALQALLLMLCVAIMRAEKRALALNVAITHTIAAPRLHLTQQPSCGSRL